MRLDRHFTIAIVDCGSTMDAPVTQEALRDMDALDRGVLTVAGWRIGRSADDGMACRTMARPV